MRRGRKLYGGLAVLVAAFGLSAPAAVAASGAAVDQGYPCATTPPSVPGMPGAPGGTGGTGQCGTTSPPVVSTPAPPVVSAPAPVHTPAAPTVTPPVQTQNVAGATHTVQRSATPKTAANVAPAQAGTLPFTGAQLGVFVVLGLLLIAGGLVLRASGRNRPTA